MFEVKRRRTVATVAVALLLVTAGCSGLTQSNSGTPTPTGLTQTQTQHQEPQSTQTVTTTAKPTTSTEPPNSREWSATVDIRTEKTSLATGNTVFNGWNVSVEVTSVNGADEVVYVYEPVNVVEGPSTFEGVVGTGTGDTTSSNSLSLLQQNETVTVYAVKNGERKQIGFLEITSSYTASWDGERSWDDSWRGETPEGVDT